MDKTRFHFQFLDYVRGVAILAVFLFHCLFPAFGHDQLRWAGWFRDFSASPAFLTVLPATYGFAGVPIFFVVSGFCIHLSYARSAQQDGRSFYVRRLFRIYPPYLLAVFFFSLVFPLTRLSSQPSDWLQLVSHLLLVHNFDSRTFFGINPAFWSIAIEVQLYLLYPLVLAMSGQLGWKRTLVVLGVVEVILRSGIGIFAILTGHDIPTWFHGIPFLYWYSWSLGAALSDAVMKNRTLPFASTSAPLWFVLAIVTHLVRPLTAFSFLFFALLTATLIAKRLEKGEAAQKENWVLKHLRLLGVWSYSFYLLHEPFLALVPHLLNRSGIHHLNPLLFFALCAGTYPFVLGISGLFNRYCEVPSAALGKRFLQKSVQPSS